MEWTTLSLFISIVALIIHYLWKLGTSNFDLFEKQGIPYRKPLPFVGNFLPLYLRRIPLVDFIKDICDEFSDARVIGLFNSVKPLYLIKDPELIKQISVKDFDHFTDRHMRIDPEVDPFLGNNLGSLSGQKWKDMRSTLSPVFTGSKMRQMFDLLPEVGIQMAEYFKTVSDAELVVEMKDIFGRFALDAIATTNFGVQVNSLKEKENNFYTKTLALVDFKSFLTNLRFLLVMTVPELAKILKIKVIAPEKIVFFTDLVKETELMREQQKIIRPDLIHLMMQIKKGQLPQEEHIADESIGFATVQESDLGTVTKHKSWNDLELLAQAFLFFFAGFETVSMVLSFISYELALNQDVQRTLCEEIDSINEALQGKRLTYELLQTMKYMDMVVSETLRLWTPADFADRKCVKDYKFINDSGNEITMTAGSSVWLTITALQMSPKYYENPKKFDPERFSEENKHKIVNGTYLPFGTGPRNCIGSRFALMEVKTALFYLLRDFTFQRTEKTQVPLQILRGFTNGKISRDGVWLKLQKRNET